MNRLSTSIGILAFAGISAMPLAAQATLAAAKAPVAAKTAAAKSTAAKKTGSLRTPWGDPDLQGVWNDATATPLQRPNTVGAKDVLSDDEAAEFQAQLAHNLSRDRRDGGNEVDVNRAYNDHWMDSRRLKITNDHRTSLIVDPPDGRLPPLVPPTPERAKAKADAAAANKRFNAGLPDTYMDFSLPVRCIIRTDSAPYLPTIYNNDFHIFQSPGYVMIEGEMIHSARIIPLDGRPHLGQNLKQWLGDPRGHWDGNSLVVETTNFRSEEGPNTQGANPATYTITERFTRVDANSMNYEFTINDPTTWTKPWTAVVPWNKIDPGEQLYEYACHEDNYDMVHFLTGARARQAKGEAK